MSDNLKKDVRAWGDDRLVTLGRDIHDRFEMIGYPTNAALVELAFMFMSQAAWYAAACYTLSERTGDGSELSVGQEFEKSFRNAIVFQRSEIVPKMGVKVPKVN